MFYGTHITVKPALKGHSKRRPKIVLKTDYHLMQVRSIVECSKRAFYITALILSTLILSTFFKTFVLSIFECLLKTGFTVHTNHQIKRYAIYSTCTAENIIVSLSKTTCNLC